MRKVTNSERLISIILVWLHLFFGHALSGFRDQEVKVNANKNQATAVGLIVVSLNLAGHWVPAINTVVLGVEKMWQRMEEHLSQLNAEA